MLKIKIDKNINFNNNKKINKNLKKLNKFYIFMWNCVFLLCLFLLICSILLLVSDIGLIFSSNSFLFGRYKAYSRDVNKSKDPVPSLINWPITIRAEGQKRESAWPESRKNLVFREHFHNYLPETIAFCIKTIVVS